MRYKLTVIFIIQALSTWSVFAKEKKGVQRDEEVCNFGKIIGDCNGADGQNNSLKNKQLRELDRAQATYFPIRKPFQLHEHYLDMLKNIEHIRGPYDKLCGIVNRRYDCRAQKTKECKLRQRIQLPLVDNVTGGLFHEILLQIGGECHRWLKSKQAGFVSDN